MKTKRVGDYELLETLGSGTFGKVRRARHIVTGDEYAVKCIDKTMLEKQKMRTQLKREISIAKMIQHPRVVQLFEVLASKTKIYLVLELVTGGELFDLLVKEKGFGEVKARHFFKQLVDGIMCCHDKGICHRDIKPENLLLDNNGDLKISDFGLSGLHDPTCGDATMTQSKMLHTSKCEYRGSQPVFCLLTYSIYPSSSPSCLFAI
jgi:serine/threonine protein kinase